MLAASARAELALFDAGPNTPSGALYSADGYHYAYLASDEHGDQWIVDGRARARGLPGALAAPAALSADGSILFHFLAVRGGWAPAINGRRVGRAVYGEIGEVELSRSGRNAAFSARTPQGWVVVSGQGTGPAFSKPPLLLAASEKSTAYVVVSAGAQWLYRDHKPVRAVPFSQMALSPDLKRVAGLWRDDSGKTFVEVDGTKLGPWTDASAPVFSPNGRHVGFLAGEPPSSVGELGFAVIDGVKTPIASCTACALILDDSGRAFEDKTHVVVDDKAQIHAFLYAGTVLGEGPSFGAAAGHYGFTALSGGSRGPGFWLDGRMIEPGAPLALAVTPPVFDGPSEYHYWTLIGTQLVLACGSTEGGNPRTTRCAATAAALGWRRTAQTTPPASAVSAP